MSFWMGKRLLLSALGGSVLLWGAFSAWFFIGNNHRLALAPVTLPPGAWQVVQGGGREIDREIRLETPGRWGNALAAGRLKLPVEIADIERIHVRFKSFEGLMQASAGVSGSKTLSGRQLIPLVWGEDGEGWVEGREFFRTDGKAHFVLIELRGALDPPVVIDQVELELNSPGFFELQRMLGQSLFSLQPWTQRSINQLGPDYRPLFVTPVLAVVAWIGVALLMFLFLSGFRAHRRSLLGAACVLILAGWLLLDFSWQLRLWRNHFDAVQKYAGKTPVERREADIDGDVFRFVEALKARLDDPDQRWVIFGDSAFTHLRARYFAVPQPVVSRQGINARWLWRMRPGFLGVFLRRTGEIEASPVEINRRSEEAESVQRPAETLVGRDARLIEGPDGLVIAMQPDERPWLIQSGWFDVSPGIWRLKIPVGAREGAGWLRVEVFLRDLDEGPRKNKVLREVFVRPGEELRDLVAALVVGENQQVLFQVRELDAKGSIAGMPRLEQVEPEENLVELRRKGSPWSFLARKVLESEVGVAYEML